MRYQLIMPYYNGDIVELIARNEMGYKTVVNAPKINSYLYIEAGSHIKNDPAIIYVDRETPYYDLKGRRMWKIETKQPTDVKRLRYYYKDTGEADIPFGRRVMIDLGITGAFDENLKPVKDWFLPPSICVVDIETLSLTERSWKVDMKRGQLAVAMVGMKFIDYTGKEENLQFILEPELEGETLYKCNRQQEQKLLSTGEIIVEEILEIHFKKEADILRYFWMTIRKVWSDVIAGWNVKFDTDYPLVRSWRLVDRYPELREYVGDEDDWEGSQEEKCKKFWANKMKILRFDLMNSYAELYKPKSKKLKYVAKYEEISDREHETGGIFHKLFWSDRKEAIRYNWDDVFDTARINLKHDIIPYYWENKNMAGMETLEKSIKAGNLLDAVRLRLANNKVVLPTHSEIKEVKKIKGAEVFDPEKGVFYNVGTLDASRYYPSIILAFPELFHPITVQMVEWISKGRDVLEEKLEKLTPGTPKYKSVELRRDQRKFLLNAVYGDLADKRSRLYNRRMAGDITRLCREGINGVADLCKQKGLLVIQGDSIVGDEPLLLKKYGKITIKTIEELFTEASAKKKQYNWIGREYINTGYEAWTENGFTPIKHVMRHKTKKSIKRIITHGGVVDVTSDHSLIRNNGEIVKPSELKIGDKLLFSKFKFIVNEEESISEDMAYVMGLFAADGSCGRYETRGGTKYQWKINSNDRSLLEKVSKMLYKEGIATNIYDCMESSNVYLLWCTESSKLVKKWRAMFYTSRGKKKVPNMILNESKSIKLSFLRGYYQGDGYTKKGGSKQNFYDSFEFHEFTTNSKSLACGVIYLISSTTKQRCVISYRKEKDAYRIRMNKPVELLKKRGARKKELGEIKAIIDLGVVNDYVYDLETETHHFQAGTGGVIVKNTDGLGIVLDTDEKNTDTQALVEKGLKLNKEINIFLQEFFQKAKNPERIKFKLEKIWQPFVSTDKKKMYFGRVIWQDGKEVDRVVMRGLRPRRRDSSDLTDRVVTKVCDLVLYEDVSKVIPYVREIVRNFTKIDLEELMISIGVNKPLKKYKVNTMHKRGSEYANDYIYEEERIMEGSRVFTMYCKVKNPSKEFPQTDVIAVELPEDLPKDVFAINRDKMLEKTVEKPLETVFDAIGLKWKDIKLQKNVKKLFARKPR